MEIQEVAIGFGICREHIPSVKYDSRCCKLPLHVAEPNPSTDSFIDTGS